MGRRGGRRLREEVREHQWRTLREARAATVALVVLGYPALLVVALGLGAVLSAVAGVWPPVLLGTAFRRGAVLGAALVGLCWWAREIARVLAAGAERARKGAEGEELTDHALRPLRRRGWHVVHDIEFPGEGNVDHLLIGPGGVIALDSKYTTQRLWVAPRAIGGSEQNFIGRAKRAARLAERALAEVGVDGVEVEPSLVFWGPGAPRIEGGLITIQNTLVMEGRSAKEWRGALQQRPRLLDPRLWTTSPHGYGGWRGQRALEPRSARAKAGRARVDLRRNDRRRPGYGATASRSRSAGRTAMSRERRRSRTRSVSRQQ